MKKLIGVVSGGYSGEAAVSMKSAAMVMSQMDRSKYLPVQIVIEKSRWYALTESGEAPVNMNDFTFVENGKVKRPDLCFIIIHGTPGEDGKLQGYFEMIGMPYTTGGVMNMALTFNKVFTTRLLRNMGFNAAGGVVITHPNSLNTDAVVKELGLPLFVKPNEGGSSIGASKVNEAPALPAAVAAAHAEGSAVLIESFITGREFTCGVLCIEGKFKALAITEISTKKEFFDFAAKYAYDQTEEITPAQLPESQYSECQRISERIAEAFNCRGVVRIDYKLMDDKFYVIEINTVPGMTEHSIVPQQAAALGISKPELINMLIADCAERGA
jgi:D-alanine-D-alanine ligase